MTNNKYRIAFDLDGTIVGLYGVENWLEHLVNEDTTPYAIAKPLVNLSLLARYLNKIQKMGIEIGIISWLSKSGSEQYNEAVAEVKKKWLAKHLPSVVWDSVVIIPYGTSKNNYCGSADDVLFDDELRNRAGWGGRAYDETAIFKILKELINQ